VTPAAAAVLGRPHSAELALWHGFNGSLLLGVLGLSLGILLFLGRECLVRETGRWLSFPKCGPARWYELGMNALERTARSLTACLQNGSLARYLAITITATAVFATAGLLSGAVGPAMANGLSARFHEAALGIFILACALAAVRASSIWIAVVSLGGAGYAVAVLFALFSAPDLAMTQFMIESLTVILFLLAVQRLPQTARLGESTRRPADAALALTVGGLVYAVASAPPVAAVSEFFVENAPTQAHGQNVVNVILVDFRGLDTLGEITVLATAAIGVHALLKLKTSGREGA
jgi:multicomponent Na+:H+ antiporter subunit A